MNLEVDMYTFKLPSKFSLLIYRVEMFLFFIIGIVDIGDSCGETITLGDKTKNGFINLFNKAGPPDSLPDLCEVYLPAKQGLSLHIRFIVSLVSGRAIKVTNCEIFSAVKCLLKITSLL